MVEGMKIHVYMVCWNEEELLPFFFKHYERFADKIIAYDNMSSDGTRELLESHPLCERRIFDTGGEVRDDLLIKLKNEAWKESRGQAEWVIVCDADEFIYHPDLPAYLKSCQQRGITIPQPTGFNMVSEKWPEPGSQIWEQMREGRPDLFFSKKALFDPNAVSEINYDPGAHACSPVGRIKVERDPQLKLLHYKYIGGADRLRERRERFTRRLSQVNKKHGWGTQAGASDALREYAYEKSIARPLNLEPQISVSEPQRRKILFVGGVSGFDAVSRLAGLAQSLDSARYEAHLACEMDGSAPPATLPFNVLPIASIPARKVEELAAQGKPIFDADTLEKLIWEDMRVLRELSPDVVVGDMRQSLSISARLAHIPYVNIINAQWSPFAQLPPEPNPHPLASFLSPPLANLFANFTAPLGMASHIAPLNFMRPKYGVPPLRWDIKHLYSDGDFTLYPDIPQLVPTQSLPPHHRYIGPILWSPQTPFPEWWNLLPTDKPLVYLNLGSSGQSKLLPLFFKALSNLPLSIIAASPDAAALKLEPRPSNIFLSQYLPGTAAAARSQLVICNGGNMSTQQALAEGTPVLMVVSNLDQLMFARAVERAGAGEVMKEEEVTEAKVRRVVWRMLKWQGYKMAAQRLSLDCREMDAARSFPNFIESMLALV
jgi:UDP:flavonoid glycosyltransferase YjiC (YdhE family)